MEIFHYDILIAGASLGGVSAALSAGKKGASVCLMEETDWVGGQLTAQGVCTPDENAWIETGGAAASYIALRRDLRDHYRTHYRLSTAALDSVPLNIGNCWVSRIAAEPKVARDVLFAKLRQYPNIHLMLSTRAISAAVTGDMIQSLTVQTNHLEPFVIYARIFLDATDTGELLPLTGAEYSLGAESLEQTGEPDAPGTPHPEWIQPFTFPFAVELRPEGENHTIPEPPFYQEMKEIQRYHILDGAMRGMFGDLSWWNYRRVIAAENFDDPAFPCDIAMINVGSNDCFASLLPHNPEADGLAISRGRLASVGYLRWLQTECPRQDGTGKRGYPELKLRADMFDTPDGLSVRPYIRESRRIHALHTIVEQDIVVNDSSGISWQIGPRAVSFTDSCGIGHYWLDVHAGPSDDPPRFMNTRPFQISASSLVPVRILNLLASCKNHGTTHLTGGAYRLHPVEWNTGESAGSLAAFCIVSGLLPRDVVLCQEKLAEWQYTLLQDGIPLFWWGDIEPGSRLFMPSQILAMRGLWPAEDILLQPEMRANELQMKQMNEVFGVDHMRSTELLSRERVLLLSFERYQELGIIRPGAV